MLFQTGTGYYLEWSGGAYTPLFVICGGAYLVAWCLRRLLAPTRVSSSVSNGWDSSWGLEPETQKNSRPARSPTSKPDHPAQP